jgi:ATP/maltotriose-dependent transcriptional regulator MalT
VDLEDLLERDAVLSALTDFVDGVGGGMAAALFLVAGAGLGKSSLLDWVARLGRRRGLVTLRAGGEVMESGLGFGLLDQVLLGLDRGRSVDVSDFGPSADARAARFVRALGDLQSTRGPTGLIVLDDLHWADADSLAFVSFLCRRLRALGSRWGVVGAMRPWPQDAVQVGRSLVHDGHASVVGLSPLTECGAARLLEARLGADLTDALTHQIWAATAGNPLLLHQVAEIMSREGRVEFTPGTTAEVAKRLLLARFGGLPETGMRWLRSAAVLGSRFLPELAGAVAGLGEDEQAGAMESALYAGVITSGDDGRTEFRHPLFREAVYQDLPVPVRVMLHGRAVRELVGRGLDAEAAGHAMLARRVGDRESIDLLARTGAAALAQGAFEAAVDRLGAAVDLSGANPDASLLMGLGQALSACHRTADAVAILGRLLGDTDVPPAIRVQALRLLARVEYARDDRSASRRHFAEAAEAAQLVSTEMTVDVFVEWAYSESPTNPGRAMPIAARARSRARPCDRVVAWRAEIVWASSVLITGDAAGLAELADPDALQKLLAGPEGPAHWSAEAAMVTVALLTERYDADDDRFGRTLSAAEAAGAAEAAASFALLHAYGLTRLGRLSHALDALDRARAWVDVVAAREGLVNAGYAYVLLLMGRLDESQDRLDRACSLAVAHADPQTVMTAREVAGHRALREGELTVAHERYLELEEISTSIGIGDPCMGAWAGHAVHAHLATGHRQDADRVIGWLRDASLVYPCRWPRIALETALAMRADIDGDASTAEEHFLAALAHHNHATLPVERVQTLLAYAGSLRRHGHPVQARPLLREAVTIGQACGANWLVEYARTELGIAGGRFRVQGDPDRLTPAEHRVADLAAAGLSNREIAAHLGISETTVETHLGHVYQKKGITSRRQLTRAPNPPSAQ